ncbi:hypothetical protein DFH28DRAFT_1056899 [Melampsora americana]|nr:hypothetical protein DFH28DRAFT_1056899 [Melampsora americana]
MSNQEPNTLTTNSTNADQTNLTTTTTLFISKLPPTLTSETLLKLASSIGPVRKAFIVKSKSPSNQSNNHQNHQIGYVRYVLRSDAENAIKLGFELNPKPLISWAKPRPSMKERRQNLMNPINPNLEIEENQSIQQKPIEKLPSESNPELKLTNENLNPSSDLKPIHQPQTSYKKDPTANRTVVLQGLPFPPSTSTQDAQAYTQSMIKSLYKRARKLGQIESVIYPAPAPFTKTSQVESSTYAHLTFYDPTIASRVCKRLHLHIFKGSLITTCIKSRLMSNSKLGPKHSGGRLIIRNLNFNVTEDDLRLTFGKFGQLQSIELPKDPITHKSKGFGFVWMINYIDAERAMNTLNGTSLSSGLAKEFIQNEVDGEKKSLKRKREKEEATEDELYHTFKSFGPLNYARIVMDPKTQRSRGTGFVCMKNKGDGLKVLEISKSLESEGLGQGPLAANGLPSLLQPDPSSGLASQLSLHGRVLGVSEAVTKNEAERLRIERDQKGVGKDKRNLYLMKEGLILPGTSQSNLFDPSDLKSRQASFDERKSLLRTNLSLYISKTRLSIRQIPTYVSNRSLKRLARFALNEWRQEVKQKKREELSFEELEPKVKNEEKDEKASKIKQVKVIIDPENKGKSKGYGFIEVFSHSDALRIVRYVNENLVKLDELLKLWTIEELEGEGCRVKSLEEDGKEKEKRQKKVEEVKRLVESGKRSQKLLMVEFAIENAQTVKKRIERSEKLIERQKMKLAITSKGEKTEERTNKRGQKDHEKKVGKVGKGKKVDKVKKVEKMKSIEKGSEKDERIKSLIGKKRKIRREKKRGK